jgi:GTPase involved in cell partitioning and DNA repair
VLPTDGLGFVEVCEKYEQYSKKKLLKASAGEHSKQLKLIGKPGDARVIDVPFGVECVDANTRLLLARCTTPGMKYLIARGGVGGCAENGYK